jgi:hypothetical protein
VVEEQWIPPAATATRDNARRFVIRMGGLQHQHRHL